MTTYLERGGSNLSTCIFCNKEVESKTKEHIIPKWLLKLTNNPSSRQAYLINNKQMPFTSYTFPACNACNEVYSKLEYKTRSVFDKILSDGKVNASDLSTLLDWFDKLRVGIWYGELMVNNKIGIVPRFGINDRIKSKDRFLTVSRTNKKEEGINIYGTNFSAFTSLPSYIGFRINDFLFLSVSNDFIVSQELGLPYVSEFNSQNLLKGILSVEDSNFKKGTEEKGRKIVKYPFSKYCNVISQPIVNKELLKNKNYTSKYVEKSFHNFEEGIGQVFITPFNDETQIVGEKEFFLAPDKILDFENVLSKFVRTILLYQKSAIDTQLKEMDKIISTQENKDILYKNLKYFQTEYNDYLTGNNQIIQDDFFLKL